MDTPENYYAMLGIPLDADTDTIKRAYRQLARRYHPDLAGPEGAIEMKRINRAYAVLSDAEKRKNYDIIIGGVIDLRKAGFARPRPQPHVFDPREDIEFSELNIFSTKGPFLAGPVVHSTLGIISTLSSAHTVGGLLIAGGSLDGKGMIWRIINGNVQTMANVAADPSLTVESLRELRFSAAGGLLAGWGRLHLHVWDAYSGACLWSYALVERAISAHYSFDMRLQVTPEGKRLARMALPLLPDDVRAPSAWGVRGSDILSHVIGETATSLTNPLTCAEESIEKRRFWAIRMRALSQDTRTLVTLSCAQVPGEQQQMIVIRRWDLAAKSRLSSKIHPQVIATIVVGRCADCTPPYAITPDAGTIAFITMGSKILLCDTTTGIYSELASGSMGGSSRLAISPDVQWLAVAREDSELNEGVIDIWSITTGQVLQKLYHPWQISALHFADTQLIVALTDGTIQVWE